MSGAAQICVSSCHPARIRLSSCRTRHVTMSHVSAMSHPPVILSSCAHPVSLSACAQVVGHSLGAGTAALVAMLVHNNEEVRSLKPVLLSAALVASAASHCRVRGQPLPRQRPNTADSSPRWAWPPSHLQLQHFIVADLLKKRSQGKTRGVSQVGNKQCLGIFR